MRAVSISMVRNEADIVEAFVRYHSSFLDVMIVLDNASSDETSDILVRLAEEGLALHVLYDDNPAFTQAETMTSLLGIAVDELAADVVIPLDVDEFLATEGDRPLREILSDVARSASPALVEWKTYVPAETDDPNEPNVVKRIRHCRSEQRNYDKKVIVPARLAAELRPRLTQGSHGLTLESGEKLPAGELETPLFLAHYPIRSSAQAQAKYLVGWLANLARPKQVLFDWYPNYNRLKGGGELTAAELDSLARYYNVKGERVGIGVVDDPLRADFVEDFALRYTPSEPQAALPTVLNYAEGLARRYSAATFVDSQHLEERESALSDQFILQVIREYRLVEGWLSPLEAVALYRLGRAIAAPRPVVCEIGSFLGRSSYVLARSLDRKPGARLYCVDPFDASGDAQSEGHYHRIRERLGVPLRAAFEANMRRLGVHDVIHVLEGRSEEVADSVSEPIDLLFIDGDHDFEAVARDFAAWAPKIRVGGWIAFHDVGSARLPGPRRVVEQFLLKSGEWGENRLVDELYAARRQRAVAGSPEGTETPSSQVRDA